MALAATIFKAEVDISDIDRHHYRHYALTLARHPSETSERMMVRLLAFLHHADEQLKFTRGLSETSEPDLWLKDMTGQTQLWVETGMPESRRLTQASGRAGKVVVYAYGRNAPQWWKQTEKAVARRDNLVVYILPLSVTRALSEMAARSMRLVCSIQDGQLYLTNDDHTLHIDLPACLIRDASP
ncbi:YaeQ family protein [Oxalobacter sp. OttesenSCG-928-P03]|nr:YaeQ family protein [Oxalobacter sp. OttesenSCG-928-P03]